MPIDSDLFTGSQLFVFRDEDPTANGRYHASLFEGKQRRYVWQLQGKFKRQPRGPIFFQASVLDESAHLSMVTRHFANVFHWFAQATIGDFDSRQIHKRTNLWVHWSR